MTSFTIRSSKHTTYEPMRPSEVFAKRLRDRRERTGRTQQQLAKDLDAVGVPMSRYVLMEIEKVGKRIALDDAIGIAASVGVPLHMLTPPSGASLQITEHLSVAANDVREFLLTGAPWIPDVTHAERSRSADELFNLEVERLAGALVDAKLDDNQIAAKEAREKLVSVIEDEIKRKKRVQTRR
jgi:transcriptional regulator with XRE-family HTH domain